MLYNSLHRSGDTHTRLQALALQSAAEIYRNISDAVPSQAGVALTKSWRGSRGRVMRCSREYQFHGESERHVADTYLRGSVGS